MTRRLLVVRHAIAEDREAFPGDDRERPLSKRGRKRFVAGARGIVRLAGEPGTIVSSPLLRARETADLLAAACRSKPERAESEALAPGADPAELAAWLHERGDAGTVAAVGHEPHLSHLVSWLASGSPRSWIELKKGSAALLALPGGLVAGGGLLLWALSPGALRAVGGGR